MLRCPCGCDRLELHYPGGTHVWPKNLRGEPIPCTVGMIDPDGETWYYFAIKAVCPRCGDDCHVFDNQLCGWERVVNDRDAEPRAGPRKWPWRCLDCGSPNHFGTAVYSRDEEADFRERVGDQVPPEEWPDAYHWFSMAIECCGCGRKTESWVSYECR